MGFGGRVGLDYPAVKLVAETLEPQVEWNGRTLRLIQALETYELTRKPTTDTEQDADHG